MCGDFGCVSGVDVVVGVVDVVWVCGVKVGLEKGLWRCWDGFERRNSVFMPCSGTVVAITLWILRLKLWGLMFWKAYDFSYKFDVLSFCI